MKSIPHQFQPSKLNILQALFRSLYDFMNRYIFYLLIFWNHLVLSNLPPLPQTILRLFIILQLQFYLLILIYLVLNKGVFRDLRLVFLLRGRGVLLTMKNYIILGFTTSNTKRLYIITYPLLYALVLYIWYLLHRNLFKQWRDILMPQLALDVWLDNITQRVKALLSH